MTGFEELADASQASIRKLNDMLRWLFGKVQGGITREELSQELLEDIDTVDSNKLADDCITGDKIGNCAIMNCHIDDLAVTNEKVDSLSANKLTAGTIDAARVSIGPATAFAAGYDPAAAAAAAATAQASANTAQSPAAAAQTTANTAAANATLANSQLADIASDNKLTPAEKQQAKLAWDTIASEYAANDAQVGVFAITTARTNATTAYNALNTYLNTGSPALLSDLATTSAITGTTFRSSFKAYYDARTALLNAISAKAKSLADTAQAAAATAQGNYAALAPNGLIEAAKLGTSVIEGGYIKTGLVRADSITSGTMSASMIKGGTLALGGDGNGSGIMALKDADGVLRYEVVNDGVKFYDINGEYTASLWPDVCTPEGTGMSIHSKRYLKLDTKDGGDVTCSLQMEGDSIHRAAGVTASVSVGSQTTVFSVGFDGVTFNGCDVWHSGNAPKSGLGANLITGSAGATGNLVKWNTGDAVDAGVGLSGFGRAYSGAYSFGVANTSITTAEFVAMLTSLGAFAQPYWVARGSWSYANNRYISDTGCGNIHLAGCTVEVIGNATTYTIRIHTPTTSALGVTSTEFVYVNNGAAYSPAWRKIWNDQNDGVIPQANRRQDNTTNASVINQLIQYGWGYVVGDGANRLLSEAVTFPVAYDSGTVPVVIPTGIGSAAAGSTPATIGAFISNSATTAQPRSPSYTGFTMDVSRLSRDGADPGVLASMVPYGYSWVAIGTKAR